MPLPLNQETLLFEPAQPVAGALRAVLAFPSTYSVGITSLGSNLDHPKERGRILYPSSFNPNAFFCGANAWAKLRLPRDMGLSTASTDIGMI